LGVSSLSNIHYQLIKQDSVKELLLDHAATSDVFVNDSAAFQRLLNSPLLIVAVLFCSVAGFIFYAAVVIPPNFNH
jgi:hypothetical protein